MFTKIKDWYDKLPEQKKRLDFITALLTIPLLITLIISNLLNVRKKAEESKETVKPTTIIITQAPKPTTPNQNGITIIPVEVTKEVQTTPGHECQKDIGPIEITSPAEGEVVSIDPVCVNIDYNQGNFCSVVWSYRINEGSWSDYTSNSACFSNLAEGEVKFELRVKSVVTDKEILLERNIKVKREEKNIFPTPSLSPNPSPSITSIISPT